MKTSPSLQTIRIMIRVNGGKIWKLLVWLFFPSLWNFLPWKQNTLLELVNFHVLGEHLNVEGNAQLAFLWLQKKTKNKKTLLVENHVSLLNWNLIWDSQTYSWKVIRTLVAFLASNFDFSNVLFLGFNFWFDLLFQGNSPEVYFHGFPSLFSVSK